MGKEIITTIAITGVNAAKFLGQNGIEPRKFVIGVSHDTDRIETPLGKIGITFGTANEGVNHEVIFDCSDAPKLQGKRYQCKKRKISVGDSGIGEQQLRKGVAIVVVTNAR